MERVAKRSDWSIQPFPERFTVLEVERVYSADEVARIQRGLIPRDMDDKWFAFYEDGTLYIHRSWTGYCIYQARFVEENGDFVIDELRANRDAGEYKPTDEASDAAFFIHLVDILLLHEYGEMPPSTPD